MGSANGGDDITLCKMTEIHHLEDDAGLVVPATEVVEIESDSNAELTPRKGGTRIIKQAIEELHNGHPGECDDDDDDADDGEEWETESLYADALDGMGDQHLLEGGTFPPLQP